MPRAADVWKRQLQELGEFVRSQRRLAELSQRDLAKVANVSDTYLSQLERGLHQPSVRVLRAIAEGLGVQADALLSMAAGIDPAVAEKRKATAAAVPGTEDAIRADVRLSESQKKALLGILKTYLEEDG